MGIGDMDLGFGRTRRQICYHEAGYTVFYYHADLKINFVHVPGRETYARSGLIIHARSKL